MNKFNIKMDSDNFTIEYENISPILASEIDNNSYSNDDFSEIKHYKNIIDNVKFKIFKNQEIIYENLNTQKLRFDIAFQIARQISKATYCSKEEIQKFQQLCEEFLNKKNQRIPPELMLASNILNQLIQLNYKDIESIENKKYEKINLALKILQDSID
jgi:neutral trehalase